MSGLAPGGRDPDEPDRPQGDLHATFAEIVAGWDNEPEKASWPADEDADRTDTGTDGDVDLVDRADGEHAAGADTAPGMAPIDPADDHFVPPEPPPLPTPAPHTLGAFALFGLGLLLLVRPSTIGLSAYAGLLLGLLSISGGGIWLAARLRQGPPRDSGWDDGAQV